MQVKKRHKGTKAQSLKELITLICSYFVPLCLCAFVPLSFYSYANAENISVAEKQLLEKKDRLEDIQKRIRENDKELADKEKKEKSLIKEINRSNNSIELMNEELKIYEWNLKINANKKEEIAERIKRVEDRLKDKKAELSRRLRTIYKNGGNPYMKTILQGDNFMDIMQRIKYMNKIALYDVKLIDDFKIEAASLKEIDNTLMDIEYKIGLYREKVIEKKDDIEKQKKFKKQLVEKVRSKKGVLISAIADLKENHKMLKGVIDRLSSEKRVTASFASLTNFEKRKGVYTWPVNGNIITTFGKVKNKELDTFLFNNGIDIAAPINAEIKAISSGTIIYSDTLKGYGRVIIIDHGRSYYTIYGHMSAPSVSIGDTIKEGDIIGKVGRESTFTDASSLYFEIRYKGEPQNPAEWLMAKRDARVKN